MVKVLDIENAIVSRLQQALAPLPVEALPNRGYKFMQEKGACVVAVSSVEAKANSVSQRQNATVYIDVALFSRSLRGGFGCWDMFEVVRSALQGWVPHQGCGPLYLVSAKMTEPSTDTWLLLCRFSTDVVLVAEKDIETLPLLRRITIDEMGELVEIP